MTYQSNPKERKIIAILGIIFLIVIYIGCESNTNPSNDNFTFSLGNGVNPDEVYTIDEAISNYDTTNLIACIFVSDEFQINHSSFSNFYTKEMFYANAEFF